jgi:hypothetical protein
MFWQWLVVGVCLTLAVIYLVRAGVRMWRPKMGGCGGGCGCGSTTDVQKVTIIPPEQLAVRRK